MKPKLNIGVVGCGYWGPNLVRNFHSLDECRMRVICDASEERLTHLRTLYPDIEGVTDYAAMLAGFDLDAVAIATPVRFHFPMAKAALLAGKHVLIEKPMAASLAQCEELNAIAQQQGRVIMVGHTFLYSAAVRKIKEIVDNHDIGDLRYISARRLNLGLFQKDINVAWDLAPHDISIILHVMDELPHSVNCRGAALITHGIEDVTSMTLHFAKERSAIIHSSWHDPRKIREMTIVGSKRMIVYDDIAAQEKVKIFDVRVERPPHYDTFAEFHYAYHYGDTYSPYVKQDEPLRTECRHFLESILFSNAPLTSGQAGMEIVRILEASTASLKAHGAPINLAPAHHPQNSALPFSFAAARGAGAALATGNISATPPAARPRANGTRDKRPATTGRSAP